MFREIFAGVLIVAASAGFGAVDMPDLPNFPKLPISSASLDEVLASDSANAWTELADRAKDEALKAATKKNFSVAADSEMHTHKNKKTGNEPEKGDDIESF